MSRRTGWIVVMGIAIIVAVQLVRIGVRSASGQDLYPSERAALIDSMVASCKSDPSVAKVAAETVKKYCDCFGVEMASRVSRPDLRLQSITPDLQKRMEAAAAICNALK